MLTDTVESLADRQYPDPVAFVIDPETNRVQPRGGGTPLSVGNQDRLVFEQHSLGR